MLLRIGSYHLHCSVEVTKPTAEVERIHRRSEISPSVSVVAAQRGPEEAHLGVQGTDAASLVKR